MLRRVLIGEWQKVTQGDFDNLGRFPQQTFDLTTGDLGPGQKFAGFAIVQNGSTSIQVGPGRLYSTVGPVYYIADDPGVEINFLGQLPLVARRWAAITVWGQEIETQTEPRTFLTDAASRATVARVVATEMRRHVNIAPVFSQESPDPGRPAIASNVLAIAWILLGPTGILSITPAEENRASSIQELDLRANDVDSWRTRVGTRLDTLGSDLANLAGRLNGTAKLNFVLGLAQDMARVKEALSLPSDYTAWSADRFLTRDQTDNTHVDYLAKIEEGIRFPAAAERNAQLAPLNQFDQQITIQNNFMLPVYTEIPRLEVLGNDAELSISQYAFQQIVWTQLAKTRMRIRFGTPFYWCSNSYWWDDVGNEGNSSFDLTYDPIRNIYIREATGETFQILGGYTDQPDHTVWRLQQFWVDEIVDSYYWESVVTTEGLNGSIISQTFLNSQDGWLVSVELFLTRVAADGDLHVLICETEMGAPVFDRVLARSTIPVASLKVYPEASRANFVPVFLQQGRRFAIVLQTAGNHFVSLVTGNKFGQGTLFHSSDGAWNMGDIERDMAFRLNFAEFPTPRVAVQLTPLELQNGIAAIDLNVDSTRPGSCTTTFEVQVNGVWTPLGSYDSNPLNALPPLLPLRVVLTGTTDVMPGIGVGPNGWAYTWRPRSDFKHISKVQTLPAPVDTVYIDVRLEAWQGELHHSCTVRLIPGAAGTPVPPIAQSDEPDPRDPFAIVRRCVFAEFDEGTISSFRIRIDGTTDNVLECFHVAERIQVSLTA